MSKIITVPLLVILIFIFIIVIGDVVKNALYPVPSTSVPSPAPEPFSEVVISAGSGLSICGWFREKNDNSGKLPSLIFFHGNGENLETLRLSGTLDVLEEYQCNLLAIDFPGYGRSSGKPSEKNLVSAGNASVSWLKEKYPESPVIVCGWSLGAAVSVLTAAQNPGKVTKCIALSPWSSCDDVAKRFYPAWLVKIFLRDHYNLVEGVKNVECPLLIIHGEKDSLIPAEQSEKLAEAAPSLYKRKIIEKAGHNDLPGYRLTWEITGRFISELF